MAYGILKVGVVTLALAGTGVFAQIGCSSDAAMGVANAKLPEGVRSQVIEHETCD